MNVGAAERLPAVLVVMACYNGSAFLDEQLASVLAQQGVHVSILIRDDGSDDGTPEKLEDWKTRGQTGHAIIWDWLPDNWHGRQLWEQMPCKSPYSLPPKPCMPARRVIYPTV